MYKPHVHQLSVIVMVSDLLYGSTGILCRCRQASVANIRFIGDGPDTFHIHAGQLPVTLTTEAFSLNRFIEAREIYEEESRTLFPTLPLSALVSTVLYTRQQRIILCAEGCQESTIRSIQRERMEEGRWRGG